MTPKQAEQFNCMRNTLLHIAKDYGTPQQLRREADRRCGLPYAEALESAYENIQNLAAGAVSGIRAVPHVKKAT